MEGTKQRILVVEDNDNTRAVLETILRGRGYDVSSAPDAEQGLELLGSENPDLVILDLFLPRASGVQFLRIRAENDPDMKVPVIVVSGSDELDGLKPQLTALGVKLTLRKPFDVEELLSGVGAHITKPAAAKTATPSASKGAKGKARGSARR